jgi:ribosomal protein S18 acetylase RimI-like enzyme
LPEKTRVTSGDVDEALSVMREAALWCEKAGHPMWPQSTLTRATLCNPAEEFHVFWREDECAAAMLLSFHDPLFWPEIPPETSGFVHKLCVRRRFAGQACAHQLLEHAANLCQAKLLKALRLDTDANAPRLCALYESCGFCRVGTRTLLVRTYREKPVRVALYERLL